jgi:diguanylate cyclase (GGDEF)-like protein
VQTFQVARAADALATSGLALATLSTTEERDLSFHQINSSIESLNSALGNLENIVIDKEIIPLNLFAELEDNLRRLQVIVDERIKLREQQWDARKQLLSNLLILQHHLIYRVRILEGDGDVIKRLMERATPPVTKVATMSEQMSIMLPAARFYATVESINGRLLAGNLSPSLTSLDTSRQELAASMKNLSETFNILPEELRQDVGQAVSELEELVINDNGLIQLRESELLLLGQIKELNDQNQVILQRVNVETSRMVSNSQNEMVETGNTLTLFGRRAMLILVFFAGLSLLCVAGLMHFYVNRQILSRLSWLSASMQDVAAGRLDVNLPPTGPSELGRLGAALQQFRDITAKARDRELALEQAMDELKEKTAELEHLAVTDRLTGLANRRKLDLVMQYELSRSQRYGYAFSVILMDIDHFKMVNDKFGHQVGDQVLQDVAKTIRKNVREVDTPGRWGGEEFLIICPETNLREALHVASKLQKQLKNMDAGQVTTITNSFGVAELLPNENETDLMRKVDKALYKAKENGRDRIETA